MTVNEDSTTALSERLGQAQIAIEPGLRAAVERLDTRARRIAQYHFGWVDESGTASTRTSGRRRLGVLTLLCATATGAGWQCSLPAALACELAFNAALIHDDIIDHDITRRGRRSAWSVFGTAPALLAANTMTGLAVELLAEQPHPSAAHAVQRLSRAIVSLNIGQLHDVEFEQRLDVSFEDYLRIVEGKASAFTSCGCALGAVFADLPDIDGLAKFGHHLGLVWQLRNDLLGIWGDPDQTGKAGFSDLKAQKKTFPVIVALGASGPDRDELHRLYTRVGDGLTQDEAARAATLIERCGGRLRTEQETRDQLDAAVTVLHDLLPDGQTRTDLISLADFFARSGR